MIENLDALSDETALQCDLCIVGAGAAGISLLLEFISTRVRVLVIESGVLKVEEEVEQLNNGEVGELPFTGLRDGRRRGFGGTTAAWGGQCCELDETDLDARPWVPYSGWPIRHSELEPYYRRAERVFGVSGEPYDERIWRRYHIAPSGFEPSRLRSSFAVFSPRPRIGQYYRRRIENARNIRVVVGATVTNIRTNDGASVATSVEICSLAGKKATVSARAFVLCAGAVESARLLLVSRDVRPDGIGNNRGLVGRFFQDHPTSATAMVVPTDTHRLEDLYGVLYRGKTWYWPKMALAPEVQQACQTLNACAFLTFVYDSPAIEALRAMVRTQRTGGAFRFSRGQAGALMRGLPEVADAGIRRYVFGRSPRSKPSKIEFTCTIEQAPNPESRLFLSESRDPLGMQRVVVDWKITNAERRTFRAITRIAQEEFRRKSLGTIVPEPWLADDDAGQWKVWDNYHQTGTARMSSNPMDGVVDLNCQVHGLDGLFVAGAPTFPTSGYANPVLTIAALSVRLADYLKYRYFS